MEGYARGHTERLWKRWLPRLAPDAILCFGRESFRLMRSLSGIRQTSGAEQWSYRWFDTTQDRRPVRIAGLRHPGWYWAKAERRGWQNPVIPLMNDMAAMVRDLRLDKSLGPVMRRGWHPPETFEVRSLWDVREYYHQHRQWPAGLDDYLQQLKHPPRGPAGRRRKPDEKG